MKDTLFVQFYSQWKTRPNTYLWGIGNGFSETYDLCKSKGDFHWIKHNYDRQTYTTMDVIKDCKKEELPIKKGRVFVSATTTTQAYQAYIWAEKYPDVNFIVGGPSIITGTFTYDLLPKNLMFTKKSVEEYFNVPNFSYEWKLKLPKKLIQDDLDVFFTYLINSKCYWQKCIFCKFNDNISRVRNLIDFKFKDNVNTNKIKRVFLYTPSMPAETMLNLIPKLPSREDFQYVLFMRSSKKENIALEEVLKKCSNGEGPDPKNILFEVGVEFPGNRMLKYMKKGTTTDNILDTMKIIKKYKGRIAMMIMLGWPNLIKQDIEEIKDFVKKVPKYDNGAYKLIKISKTMARVNTPLHDMVEKRKSLTIGPFYSGFAIKLTKEDIIMNNKAKNILLSICDSIDFYTNELPDEYKDITM